jgi:hypothetical protein
MLQAIYQPVCWRAPPAGLESVEEGRGRKQNGRGLRVLSR